jgi:cobalt-zinc-cadmium efflux system protein
VQAYLESLPGVAEVCDLHIWALGTSEVALTAHLLIPAGYPGDAFFAGLAATLQERFGIHHPTVQIETVSGK